MGAFGGFRPPPNPLDDVARSMSILQAFDSLRANRDRRREREEQASFREGIIQLRQMADAGDPSAQATLQQMDPMGEEKLKQARLTTQEQERKAQVASYGLARRQAAIASNFIGDITKDGVVDSELFKRVAPSMKAAGVIPQDFPEDATDEQLSAMKEQVDVLTAASQDPVVWQASSTFGKLLQDAGYSQDEREPLIRQFLKAKIEGEKKGRGTTVTTRLIQTPAVTSAQKERGQFKSALADMERIKSQAPDFKDTIGLVNVGLNTMRGWAEQVGVLSKGQRAKFAKSVMISRDIESVRDAVRKATTGAQAAEKELMLLMERFNQSQSETAFRASLDAMMRRTQQMIDVRTQTIAELRAEGRRLMEGDVTSENMIGARMQQNLKSDLEDQMRAEYNSLIAQRVSTREAQIRVKKKFRDQIRVYHGQ